MVYQVYKTAIEDMPEQQTLGELEQLVLLAVLRLGSKAYGVSILDEIGKHTGRSLSRAAVYITLSRLELKGYLRSHLADPTSERGGRAKRYFEVRRSGLDLLQKSRKGLLNMWRGLEGVPGRSMNCRPPRMIEFLLRLVVPNDIREDVLSDLQGTSARRATMGERVGLWYWRQAVSLAFGYLPERLSLRPMWAGLGADIRLASRVLMRRPVMTTLVVVTLGLGIGANTAIFRFVHAILLRPLPFRDPDRLVQIDSTVVLGNWNRARLGDECGEANATLQES